MLQGGVSNMFKLCCASCTIVSLVSSTVSQPLQLPDHPLASGQSAHVMFSTCAHVITNDACLIQPAKCDGITSAGATWCTCNLLYIVDSSVTYPTCVCEETQPDQYT
jgi:hypothetical protein